MSQNFQIQASLDGLHLKDSILWFDAPTCPDISFLSSATPPLLTEPNHQKKTRWIATDEAVALANAMGKQYNALRCQYHRPFSIGSLRLEMLPSGGGLGTASLYVEDRKKSLLYAPALQPKRSPLSRQLELRCADVLIVSAHTPPDSAHLHPDKALANILTTIQASVETGFWPTVFCAPSPIAQTLTRALTDAHIAVATAGSISKINKVYTNCGVALGSYSTISGKRQKPKVQIKPLRTPRSQAYDPSIVRIQTSHNEIKEFHFPLWADIHELQNIIESVDPAEVLITGPYAKSYAESIKTTKKMSPLFANNEPTFF